MRNLRTFLLPLAATALLSTSALADGSHAIDEADKRFEEGKQLFGQKRYPEALVKFKEACAAHRTPNCPKNLGFAEYRLDHPAEAATQLREFMKLPEYAADPDRELVRKIYDDLLAKVSQVVIHAADGATVEIDRQVVGKAPLAGVVFATAGKHEVVATLKEDRRNKEFVGEAAKTVEVDLAPAVVVVPPGGGDVKPPPPNGDVPKPVPVSNAGKWIAGGALVGVGVLGLVGWGAFAAVSNGAKSDGDAMANSGVCANLADPRCVDLTDTVNRQNTFHTTSLVSLVGGLVCLAAGGGVMAWAATSKSEAPVPTVTPSVSPNSLGLTLRGNF